MSDHTMKAADVTPESHWMNLIKMAENSEFTPIGIEPIGSVKQAIEVANLLPQDDPIRLDLLRMCAKKIICTMTYMGFMTTNTELKPPIL